MSNQELPFAQWRRGSAAVSNCTSMATRLREQHRDIVTAVLGEADRRSRGVHGVSPGSIGEGYSISAHIERWICTA